MLKMHLAAGLAATALLTASAWAQTAPPPAAGAGQLMSQMSPDQLRASKLMGVDVYGSDNQKIGDIDEFILDRQGKIQGIVVGVGGFLGIGQKDVAIPYDQVQWMSNQEVQAQNNQNQGSAGGTNTAGGVTTPGATGGATGSAANQPTATGSTGTAGSGTTTAGSSSGGNDNMPARAMVKMTKADLQNAPEFRYADEANRSSGNTGGGSSGAGGGAGGTTQRP